MLQQTDCHPTRRVAAARRTSIALCAAAVVAVGAGAALADELHVPRDYFHLEAAAAAAQPGDVIVLHGNARVREIRSRTDPVVLPANVTLRGGRLADDVTLIADGLTLRRVGVRKVLRVEGDGASLVACNARSASIDVVGDSTRVERLRARGSATSGSGLQIHGDYAVVEGLSGTIGVEIAGARARVSGCRLVAGGIRVVGHDATVEGNRTSRTRCRVSVSGDRALIRRNRIGPWSKAMRPLGVHGSDAVVRGNRVIGFRNGIRVSAPAFSGTPPRVENNVVRLSTPAPREWFGLDGIRVLCEVPGAVVARNTVRVASRDGIRVEADGATIADNSVRVSQHRATRHGRGNGIVSLGRGCTIERNTVAVNNHDRRQLYTGHGFQIIGAAWTVRDNVVSHAAEHGVVLDGDGVASDNRVRAARGHGIAVVGAGPVTVSGGSIEGVGQEGLYLTSPGTVVRGVRVRGARGAGVFAHADASTSELHEVDVSGCNRGGVVNEADGLAVIGSRLRGNGGGDLVDFAVADDVTDTEIGSRSTDERLVPRGREEWLVEHGRQRRPWSGRIVLFRLAGADDDGEDVVVKLRPDWFVVVPNGSDVGARVVTRLTGAQFAEIWEFPVDHGIPLTSTEGGVRFAEGLSVFTRQFSHLGLEPAGNPDVAEWLALIQQHVRAQIDAGVVR